MRDVFRTDVVHLAFRPEGWEVLPSGAVVTRLPVWDSRHGLAARLGFGPAEEWLAAQGFRLPTVSEMNELHSVSQYVRPYTMPRPGQLADASVVRTEEAINRYRTAHMMSHRWCAMHDEAVWGKLQEAGWDGVRPVANFGKHWVAPAGTIYGWWLPDGTLIQNPSRFHAGDPTYADYATNFHAAADSEPRAAEDGR